MPAIKPELTAIIEDYRTGKIPLIAPLTLLRHHLRRHPDGYLAIQRYLQSYPAPLAIRQ